MARPQRNNVDYFPFLCDDGNKMFYLEETYGNDGFATFIKLLRELARTDFHYLDLSKPSTRMFLSAKCKVSKEVLEAIIKDLVDLEKFDKELWNENSIIWCQDFIDSIQDAYIKRSNTCINKSSLLQLLISKGIRKQGKSTPKQSKSTLNSTVNPQSKLKDSKEDNNKISFNVFWDLYNKKVGVKECELKWNKLDIETQQKIIDFIPMFLKSITDKKYQPHPKTFLNQERWKDEIVSKSVNTDEYVSYLKPEDKEW